MEFRQFYERKKEEINAWRLRRLKSAIELADIKEKAIALDIGSHEGLLETLLPRSTRYIGIDLSLSALKQGKFENKILADARHLPIRNRYFNVVFCLDVLEHLLTPEDVVKEIRRVLVEEGDAIICVPNIVALSNRLRLLFFGDVVYYGSGHIFIFTLKRLSKILSSSGFTITSKRGLFVPPLKILDFLAYLFASLSWNLIVKVRPKPYGNN